MPEISTEADGHATPPSDSDLPTSSSEVSQEGDARSNRVAVGFSGSKLPRIPPEIDGIQVNFCKNPACANFGVPPKEVSKRGRGSGSHDTYTLSGAVSQRGTPRALLRCKLCGETPPLKSNLAITQEFRRITAYHAPEPEPTCPDEQCPEHSRGVRTHPRSYQRHGKTAHGSIRYRCKECGTTFAVAGPTNRQKKPHENREIFMELVNKAPFRRIMEMRNISASTLYSKIDFLARQCQRFLSDRERKLLEGLPLGHLSVSVDRQNYYTNWTHREDKRSVPLHAVVSAENKSGYVFGAHLNFDPNFDAQAVEADVRTDNDDNLQQEYRRNARFWLKSDYKESVTASRGKRRHVGKKTALDEAAAVYANSAEREDVEVSDEFNAQLRLPETGMQVHGEYTFYAHFQFLRHFLKGAESITFYLDQDSGIRAACFAAFHDQVKAGTAHAFFVSIKKDLTKGQKLLVYNEARRRFLDAVERFGGGISEYDTKIELIKEQFPLMKCIGKYGDRWLTHPLPTMNEPEKALTHLSGRPSVQISENRLAAMYLFGSMYGADRFLELIRRRLSPLERALGSSSASGRMWYGYAPYNPRVIEKLLLLLQVYWNYCYLPRNSKDGKTPAQRMGLAKGVVRIQDIVYFDPHAND